MVAIVYRIVCRFFFSFHLSIHFKSSIKKKSYKSTKSSCSDTDPFLADSDYAILFCNSSPQTVPFRNFKQFYFKKQLFFFTRNFRDLNFTTNFVIRISRRFLAQNFTNDYVSSHTTTKHTFKTTEKKM